MKNVCLTLALVAGLISIGAFAGQTSGTDMPDLGLSGDLKRQSSGLGRIRSLQTEAVGFHTILMDPSFVIPDEGCDLADRAVIVGSRDDGGALLNTALLAVAHSKIIVMVVDGCTVLRPSDTRTAPRVERLVMFG